MQTRRVVLHIGGEKTGSTAIQRFLATNRELLRENGIFYPGEELNHSAWVDSLSDVDRRERQESISGLQRHADSLQAQLAEARSDELIVLSSELLSSRFTSRNAVERLSFALQSLGLEVVGIILYLRDQASLVRSSFGTAVKLGYGGKPQTRPDASSPYYNYKIMIRPWIDVFEKERIRVYPYLQVAKGGSLGTLSVVSRGS